MPWRMEICAYKIFFREALRHRFVLQFLKSFENLEVWEAKIEGAFCPADKT